MALPLNYWVILGKSLFYDRQFSHVCIGVNTFHTNLRKLLGRAHEVRDLEGTMMMQIQKFISLFSLILWAALIYQRRNP